MPLAIRTVKQSTTAAFAASTWENGSSAGGRLINT